MAYHKLRMLWARCWLLFSGPGHLGRIASWFASWSVPPYYGRAYLAKLTPKGYMAPTATIHHDDIRYGKNIFIGDQVIIYQDTGGGLVELGNGVRIHRDVIIQTGYGGSLTIGPRTHIQPRCQFSAYKSPIRIGRGVQIAPYCAFYPYDHGIAPDELITKQPLQTKGGIVVDDDAWLGVGVIVLDGVRIGKGAVVGAGAVVTRDVPDNAIAVGAPARVIGMRGNLGQSSMDSEK